MKNYKVKELKKLISKAKRENKTCAPFSKMKKSQLLIHAEQLGLINTEAEQRQDLEQKFTEFDRLIKDLPDDNGKISKKKKSILKALSKVSDDWNKIPIKDLREILKRFKESFRKIRKEVNRYRTKDFYSQVQDILF